MIQPDKIDQAYELLNSGKNNFLIGGSCFLRMGKININKGIDLSGLGLDFINENNDFIEIGGMTTLRTIEISDIIKKEFDGILSNSVRNIVGVQFRNLATVGATVYSRYGFSDFITALLSLDATVVLYKGGEIKLNEFLDLGVKGTKDILIKLKIKKHDGKYCFLDMRNSSSDYAILNSSLSREEGEFKIVVGARPGRAKIAENASKFLSENELNDTIINQTVDMMAKELTFGTNFRGSAKYRKEIAKVLIKRCIMEVSK